MEEFIEIIRVDDFFIKNLIKNTKQPHHHNYEEIIVVIKGTLEHFIDFNSTMLQAPFVAFITQGKPHIIRPINNGEKCDGFIIRFRTEFVSETIFQLYHFYHNNANIYFSTKREFERFVTLCELLNDEAKQSARDYSIIRSLLNTLLIILESQKQHPEGNYLAKNQVGKFKKFLQLLEQNYHRSIGVTFYAEQLQISKRNLNILCQRILQKSTNEIIQTRKLIHAKNLLATTDKSISDIGFEIGYKEKSYFSNIFKKKTGKKPSEFRGEINALFS